MLYYFIFFCVMAITGIIFNGMNILLFRINDFYFSLTLLYLGCFMACMMFPAHEVISLLSFGKFNSLVFVGGIVLAILFVILLRQQVGVTPTKWMKRMIPHHSTAITTTTQLLKNNPDLDPFTRKLANQIITSQIQEIKLMKEYLKNAGKNRMG